MLTLHVKAKTALVAAALLCITATGYLYCGYTSAQYYAGSLSQAGVQETVYISNTTYEVTGGNVRTGTGTVRGIDSWRALKLAYAVTLARRDPLFALPGTDPAVLADQTHKLSGAAELLAAKQKTPLYAEAIRHLYPIAFIYSLADLEQKRLALLSHPTESAMQRYANALITTAAAKENDLASFKNFFMQTEGSTTNTQIALFSGILSTKSERAAITQYQQDHIATKAATYSVARCMRGVITSCPSSLTVTLPDEKVFKVPETKLAEAKDVGKLWDASFAGMAGTSTVVLLNQSACLADRNGPNRVALLPVTTPEGPTTLLTNADTIYFKRIEPDSSTFDAYQSRVLGMHYTPINAFKYYICPQIGIDYGATLAVARNAAFATANPGIASEARRQLIAGSDVPSEYSARAYTEAALSEHSLTATERHAVEELALMLRIKTGGLEEILKDMTHIITVDTTSPLSAVMDQSASQEFLTHSAFPTFLRIGDQNPAALALLYAQTSKASVAFEEHHTTYEQLRTKVPYSVLLHDLRSFLTMENRMVHTTPIATPAAASSTYK